MSQRIGMADGRCITSWDSNRIMSDFMMEQNNIKFQDNYTWRQKLQASEPSALGLPLKNAACGGGPVKVLQE